MEELEVKCTRGLIPFPGYILNFFGKMLIRESDGCDKGNPKDGVRDTTFNHENIHHAQTQDFISNPNDKTWRRISAYLIFYILYLIDWIIKGIMSIFTFGYVRAYMSISFEQEAYYNDYDLKYLDTRQKRGWVPYIFKLVTKKKK